MVISIPKATGDIHLTLTPSEYMALMQVMTKDHNPNVPTREPAYWFNGVPYDERNEEIPMRVDVDAAKQRVAVKRKLRGIGIQAGMVKTELPAGEPVTAHGVVTDQPDNEATAIMYVDFSDGTFGYRFWCDKHGGPESHVEVYQFFEKDGRTASREILHGVNVCRVRTMAKDGMDDVSFNVDGVRYRFISFGGMAHITPEP